MAKTIPSCFNCAYAFVDREHSLECYEARIINWPACANHPKCGGRIQRTPPPLMCPNYRPRPEKPEGEFRQIPLGDGIYAYVDAADYEWLSQWTWRLCGKYAGRMEKGKLIFMHREIVQAPEGMVVDHKNRNKVDNTRDNLRPFTHAENARNRSKPRGTTSQFRGVSRDKKADKYQAQIHYHGWGHYIGYFTDEIEAARARDDKAVQLFGEAAQVNFPNEWSPERRTEVYAQGAAERRRLADRARRKKARARKTAKTQRAKSKARDAKPRATKPTRKSSRTKRDAKRTTKSKRATE